MNAGSTPHEHPYKYDDPPVAAPAAVDRAKTEYVVLGRLLASVYPSAGIGATEACEDVDAWVELLRAEASNADTALKIVAETHTGYDVYVAVPTRSFQPKTPTVETRKIVKFA